MLKNLFKKLFEMDDKEMEVMGFTFGYSCLIAIICMMAFIVLMAATLITNWIVAILYVLVVTLFLISMITSVVHNAITDYMMDIRRQNKA